MLPYFDLPTSLARTAVSLAFAWSLTSYPSSSLPQVFCIMVYSSLVHRRWLQHITQTWYFAITAGWLSYVSATRSSK